MACLLHAAGVCCEMCTHTQCIVYYELCYKQVQLPSTITAILIFFIHIHYTSLSRSKYFNTKKMCVVIVWMNVCNGNKENYQINMHACKHTHRMWDEFYFHFIGQVINALQVAEKSF